MSEKIGKIYKKQKKQTIRTKAKTIFQILNLVISIFAISFIIAGVTETKSVKAQSVVSCCTETNNKAICQEIPSSSCSSECNSSCVPSLCKESSQCKLGCCIDDEGVCSANSPKQACEQGGTWQSNAACNIAECQLGCCVLGDETAFVTEKRCKKLSELHGLELDYRIGIRTEIQCLALAHIQEKGACVLGTAEEQSCKITTKQECLALTNIADSFHKNYLCSNPDIALCEKQVKKGCAEGKDGVYWYDSCGNPENIYSSDKNASWNNGFLLSEADSCNANSSNANSKDCGNCNYFEGSRCSLEDNDYICKSLECKDASGKERQNGESWCEFDGPIGDGRDAVGSRHWKYSCLDGEVRVEPCADYRNEVCVHDEIEVDGEKFSAAACRINRWQECLFGNGCGKTPDCFKVDLEHVSPGSSICLPSYPPGFDLTTQEGGDVAYSICSIANIECKVIYEKKLFKDWDCIKNCHCEKKEFMDQMSGFCQSLGDCDAKPSYLQVEPVEGQKVKPDTAATELFFGKPTEEKSAIPDLTQAEYEPEDYTTSLGIFAGVAGATYLTAKLIGGTSALASTMVAPTAAEYATFWELAGKVGVDAATKELGAAAAAKAGAAPAVASTGGGFGATLSAFANVLAAAGIGAVVGTLFAKVFGLKGDAGLVLAIVGAATAVTVVLAAKGATTVTTLFGPLGLIVLGVVVVVAVILKLFGIGKTKEKIIKFECLPWQPPTGGADCEKCNDPMKPCSKYRCITAGQACKFINEGTDHELCIAGANDGTPPIIKPLGNVFTSGFGYEEIESGMKIRYNGECIPAFTLVNIGIKTDEPAQCKIDTEHKGYDEMEFYFGESNFFMYNHTMSWLMPSLDALGAAGVSPDRLANFNLFVKCQDSNGNANENEYIINFCVSPEKDITAPMILATIPASNSFLKFGEKEKSLQIYLNEPAECKYSSADKEYKEMVSSFECDTSIESMRSRGWLCNTTLTNLTQGENKFYIRCFDQPWLNGTDKEDDRKANDQSFVYVLKTSESELHIDSVLPNGTIVSGQEPITVVLEAQTSGGVDGSASCQFSFDNISFATFMITLSSSHSQTFNQLTKGSYNIYVKCEDISGNKAEASTSFTLNLDTTPPRIVRVYQDSGLKLITDEKAECAYSNNCNFRFENGTKMTVAYSTEHSTEWQIGKYYIKCRDIWANEPVGCSIVVQTY